MTKYTFLQRGLLNICNQSWNAEGPGGGGDCDGPHNVAVLSCFGKGEASGDGAVPAETGEGFQSPTEFSAEPRASKDLCPSRPTQVQVWVQAKG